tara:strand:+ start:110857 stop:111345 length:489 start_codon:yes stop_codon:yes gene_type:complete
VLKKLDHAIKDAADALEKLTDNIEDGAEHFTEQSQYLWQRSKKQLKQLKARLAEANQHLESNSDEAQLQAHLAAMDAGDHWHDLQQHLSGFTESVKHKSQPVLDRSALQTHLAKMEARDFMAKASQKIIEQYQHSREKAAEQALKTAQKIQLQCESLLDKRN